MENIDNVLFYLKESNEVDKLTSSLNSNISYPGLIFKQTEIKEVIHSRDTLLKEQELIDFSLINLERMMRLSMKYYRGNKKELIQTCLDLLEIFYYVKSVQQHVYNDENLVKIIEEVMDVNEAEMEQVRGYFENQF